MIIKKNEITIIIKNYKNVILSYLLFINILFYYLLFL